MSNQSEQDQQSTDGQQSSDAHQCINTQQITLLFKHERWSLYGVGRKNKISY